MISNTTNRCPLDIDDQTLSAWRDGLVGAGEAEQLARHVAGCGACQARLDQLATLATILRSQREPNLQPHIWSGLLAQIRSAHRRRFGRRGTVVWGSMLSAVAAIVLVALFAALLT